MFVGYEFEFYCFFSKVNSSYSKHSINNFSELSEDLFKNLILEIQLFDKSFGILKKEKSYAQLEVSSKTFLVTTKDDIKNIADHLSGVQKSILKFCQKNHSICFFKSVPNFVRNSIYKNNELSLKTTPSLASSLQINLSSFDFDYKFLVFNFIHLLKTKNIDIFLPTKNCKDRIALCFDEGIDESYKLLTPSKISWGYKDNRTNAIRVVKLNQVEQKNQNLPNYRVEFRVCSTRSNLQKNLDLILDFYFNKMQLYNLYKVYESFDIEGYIEYANAFKKKNHLVILNT
jgi:hypothetical protein